MPHEVIMPMLGMAQETGVIVTWLKQVGDPVKAGEPLMEVETDKTTMEVEAARDGYLTSIRVKAGVEVPVGQVVALISEDADAVDPGAGDETASTAGAAPAPSAASPEPSARSATPATSQAPAMPAGRVLASPKAKALARKRGIDLAALANGRQRPIHVADLENLEAAPGAPASVPGLEPIASPSTRRLARQRGVDLATLAAERGDPEITRAAVLGTSAPAAGPAGPDPWDVDHARFGPVEARAVTRFERVAAANLAAAQRIPTVTHHDRADVTDLEALRADLADEAAARGVRLTATALHVRALARALEAFPSFNASLSADGRTLWLKRYVAIGIAVDTPHGLSVPVLREAERKDIWQIAAELADLAERARARRLRPEETGGASMTLTNLGGIGGVGFTPIINPPELAILGLSRTTTEPVWDGEVFRPRRMVPLDLSYDHRVINGADAARFTVHYAQLLNAPDALLT